MAKRKLDETQLLRDPISKESCRVERILFDELQEASQLLENSSNFGRDAAIKALNAVGGFLLVRGASGSMLRPLQLLKESLSELDTPTSDGRIYVPEMLDPHPFDEDGQPKSKRSRSFPKTEIKRYAAACVAALIDKGSSPNDAAKKVSRAADKWPTVDNQAITPSTMHSWWRDYNEAMKSDPFRQQVEYLVREFGNPNYGQAYLQHTLKNGPPLLGGVAR